MFTDLSGTGTRGYSGYYGYGYQPPSSPSIKRRSMLGPFAQLHSRHKQVIVALVVGLVLLAGFLYMYPLALFNSTSSTHSRGMKEIEALLRYPFQQSYHKYESTSTQYSILIVADMDKASKTDKGNWRSLLKGGTLTRQADGKYSMKWESEVEITSTFNDGARGMELSELAYFNDQLLTFDDRTGIVYFVEGGKVIPKHILMDGNGHIDKGLKIEWATVKDDHLYVGSTGKEWTTPQGEFKSNDPLWIAKIDTEGRIERLDWSRHYTALRQATGTQFPGYLLHEGVRWNAALRRWFFLPRRVSKEAYDDALDESRGSNTVISMSEQFSDIRVTHAGNHDPTHGFASFQFIPFREHEIVALKTKEHQDTISTYIMVFTLDGQMLLDEVLVGNVKFEGIEFV